MEKTPADIIILYKCTKNHDHILYYSWDIVRDGCNCYFSFWAIFALLHAPPPSAPPVTAWKMKMKKKKKKNRKKKQKQKNNNWRYHFRKYTKNHDDMLYCSWDMVHDICHYFSFWAIFCPFTP